jgi:hypothetical protein
MSKVYNVVSAIFGCKLRCCGSLIKKQTYCEKKVGYHKLSDYNANRRLVNTK